MARKILVVDDTRNMQTLLKDFLEKQNYEVLLAFDGIEATDVFEKKHPDMILLDIMMPRMDGFQFLTKLRQTSKVPVIMISARQQENDIIKGFELGADDYICKPFRLRELLMRIRAVMRRTTDEIQNDVVITVQDIQLDRSRHEIRKQDKLIETTPIEFALMEMFLQSAGKVLKHQDVSVKLMDLGFSGSDMTLKIHIRNLRVKLGDEPGQPTYIENVFGVGYRFLDGER